MSGERASELNPTVEALSGHITSVGVDLRQLDVELAGLPLTQGLVAGVEAEAQRLQGVATELTQTAQELRNRYDQERVLTDPEMIAVAARFSTTRGYFTPRDLYNNLVYQGLLPRGLNVATWFANIRPALADYAVTTSGRETMWRQEGPQWVLSYVERAPTEAEIQPDTVEEVGHAAGAAALVAATEPGLEQPAAETRPKKDLGFDDREIMAAKALLEVLVASRNVKRSVLINSALSKLSKDTGFTESDITAILGRLDRRGFVTRSQAKAGGYSYRLVQAARDAWKQNQSAALFPLREEFDIRQK
jgi:DNA-binding MarR family transcriptional regulator